MAKSSEGDGVAATKKADYQRQYRQNPVNQKKARERRQQQTRERKAAGLCVRCGKQPAVAGRSRCAPCAAQARADNQARYDRRVVSKQCLNCTQPARPGKRHCAPCAAKATQRQTQRNHQKTPQSKDQAHGPS